MKKIKVFLFIMLGALFIPFSVLAEESNDTQTTNTDNKVNIYFFRGEGCSHCAEAEEFFESIKDEYGEYFNLVDYETWYNTDNQKLMEQVAAARDEEANGVPYIIIGDQSWNGYSSDYDDAIKTKIKEEYQKSVEDRYDIMNYIDTDTKDKSYASDIVAIIIIILVVGGIIGGIYYARKKTA